MSLQNVKNKENAIRNHLNLLTLKVTIGQNFDFLQVHPNYGHENVRKNLDRYKETLGRQRANAVYVKKHRLRTTLKSPKKTLQ